MGDDDNKVVITDWAREREKEYLIRNKTFYPFKDFDDDKEGSFTYILDSFKSSISDYRNCEEGIKNATLGPDGRVHARKLMQQLKVFFVDARIEIEKRLRDDPSLLKIAAEARLIEHIESLRYIFKTEATDKEAVENFISKMQF